jgi:hypothetical protein
MAKIFFKGLNELKAIVALAVIVHHIKLFKFKDSRPSMFLIFPLANRYLQSNIIIFVNPYSRSFNFMKSFIVKIFRVKIY